MLARRVLVVFLGLCTPGLLSARDKTDVVYFTNGDSIHCEIKELKRGKLTVKSIGFGTIDIEWDKIAHIESDHHFQLELQSGIRYIGAIAPGPENGKLEVETVAGTSRIDHSRIVDIDPVNESFFSAIDGSLDIGYDFTVASSATSWNLGAELRYRKPKYDVSTLFDSLYKTQNGADSVNRQNLTGSYVRFLKDRWVAFGLGQIERSANQSLEFRGLVGGGGGRRLLQTNRTNIAVLGGFSASREKYTDTEFLTNATLLAGFLFDTYRFNSPEIEVTANVLFLPVLTGDGRYRFQANAKLRLELLKDLYWQFALFESFDNNPPSETARRNDFGLTTSFGWSF